MPARPRPRALGSQTRTADGHSYATTTSMVLWWNYPRAGHQHSQILAWGCRILAPDRRRQPGMPQAAPATPGTQDRAYHRLVCSAHQRIGITPTKHSQLDVFRCKQSASTGHLPARTQIDRRAARAATAGRHRLDASRQAATQRHWANRDPGDGIASRFEETRDKRLLATSGCNLFARPARTTASRGIRRLQVGDSAGQIRRAA